MSGSPSLLKQRHNVTWYPGRDSSGSDSTIHLPQHTYIHHQHQHTKTTSYFRNIPIFCSPNQLWQHDIASWYPRGENSSSNAKIQDRHNSSDSGNNGHYRKGHFHCIHSSSRRWHHQYHDNNKTNDIYDKEMVESGWSVGKIKLTTSYPGAWLNAMHKMCYI